MDEALRRSRRQNVRVPFHLRPFQAVVVLASLAVLAIVTSVSLLLWELRGRELHHSRQETLSVSEIYLEQTQQQIEAIDLALTGVQERLQNPFGSRLKLDSLPIHLLLRTRILGLPLLRSIFLVDEQGKVVNTSNENLPPEAMLSDRPYYKVFAEGGTESLFIDRPTRNRVNGHWSLFFSKRIEDAQGHFRGVIVASMNLEKYEQGFHNTKLDTVQSAALYFEDGTLIASSPHLESLMGSLAPELHGEKLPRSGEPVRLVFHAGQGGADKVYAMGHLPHYPLLLGVTNDEALSLATWRETATPIALGACLTCFFIVIVAFLLAAEMQREQRLSAELSQVTDRYEHTIDAVMDAIVAVDQDQHIVLFNPAAERMFQRTAAESMGQPLSILMPQRFQAAHVQHVLTFARSGQPSRTMAPQLEIMGLRSDGKEFPIESTISVTRMGGVLQMTAVLRDVSEHRKAEAQLRRANQQLRHLSASLQDVREQERSRIASELHDDLGQQLTGLKLDFSWLRNRLRDGRSVEPEKIAHMKEALDQAIASVRRISSELRPPILDDSSWGEAIEWLASETARRSGLNLSLDLTLAPRIQNKTLATALFRITQEALTNIIRHARAQAVCIRLLEQDQALRLVIEDDGQGLPAERQSGVGLASMQERAMAMGGEFDIHPNPLGRGTQIEIRLPLSSAYFRNSPT